VGVRAFIGFGNDVSERPADYYKPAFGLRGDISEEWRYDAREPRPPTHSTCLSLS
jgi:hypothetical protein